MTKDCIFCKIANGEIPSEKIYENDNFFSIYDIHPALEGHTQVISKKHFPTMIDLPNTLGTELLDCIKNTTIELTKKYNAEGFNVVSNLNKSAGQIVPHFHIHIVPRKESDNGELKFIDKDTKKSIELKDK